MKVAPFLLTLIAMMLTAVALPALAEELELLPLGGGELATSFGRASAGSYVATASSRELLLDELAAELVKARVVLIGEAHTDIEQKAFHAALLEAMAGLKRELVLGMEFFLRTDQEALDAWLAGSIDDGELLRRTAWYDRGSYRFEYYRPVMEVARSRGLRVVGLNLPREIPRAVNRGGLKALTDEQRAEVGEVATDGSPEHRYLIARYFGETVALMPPDWFENMYAAQCLWDVVMARSILANLRHDETMVVIVGSGHVAYGVGISRRIAEELAVAGRPAMAVATFCPVTAPPPPDPDDDPAGHPMGGHGKGMGAAAASPAGFTRTLADYVGVFPDAGGVEAYPQLGFQLAEGEGPPTVSMVWPDSTAAAAGLASSDRIVDVNGLQPVGRSELRTLLAAIEWRQRVGFLVERDGRQQEIAMLLYPKVDLNEPATAPGWSLAPAMEIDPEAAGAVAAVAGEPAPRSILVSRGGVPQWLEVRAGEALDEVHEVDSDGRVVRSLYRTPRVDGAVELRYRRGADGSLESIVRVDRSGRELTDEGVGP
jgi:uncharacterized iron-regulated protein